MNHGRASALRDTWRKSSRSSGNGQCVEVADLAVKIGVRDSKAPHTGHLTFAPDAWAAFMAEVKAGHYGD